MNSKKFSIRVLATCSVAALSLGVTGMASAQTKGTPDYTQPAAFGDYVLSGNVDQRETVELSAGGQFDATSLGGNCIGMIAEAPDVEVELQAGGGRMAMSAISPDADVSLVVNTPDGSWVCDDDSGGNLNPRLVFQDATSGVYDVWVGELGDGDFPYADFVVELDAQGGTPAPQPSRILTGSGQQTATGRLQSGDDTLVSDEYADRYEITANAGDFIFADVTSNDFDTYLILIDPHDEQIENDDYEGSTSRSRVETTAGRDGIFEVLVTSYAPGESGRYSLQYGTQARSNAVPTSNTMTGTLASGDDQLDDGEWYDSYDFTGSRGDMVTVSMSSNDFDAFVGLIGPSGVVGVNDDGPDGTNSLLEVELPEDGEYSVVATSYAVGEVGAYSVSINTGGSRTPSGSGASDTSRIALGSTTRGSLDAGDRTGDGDQYEDFYAFNANAGQSVRVSMESTDIDTFLEVEMPDGSSLENDDFEGSLSQSVVEFQAPESGRYTITATSYGSGETGDYSLAVTETRGAVQPVRPGPTTISTGRGSNVYGIFVGISDYAGYASNLSYTADDAVLARDAVVNAVGMPTTNSYLLTDAEATRANVEAAFADLSRRMGPDDTLVFFFSGHGGRVPRMGAAEMADIDGMDETLALRDDSITDNEFDALLDNIPAARALIILDSCYSGGFAKDVISAPGRMGLFSSEEDVVSLVAAKFRAGGYLAHFFREALESRAADSNSDAQPVPADELPS